MPLSPEEEEKAARTRSDDSLDKFLGLSGRGAYHKALRPFERGWWYPSVDVVRLLSEITAIVALSAAAYLGVLLLHAYRKP